MSIAKIISLEVLKDNCKNPYFQESFTTIIPSATREDTFYTLTTKGYQSPIVCQCEAYERNHPVCWHRTRFSNDLEILKNYMESVVKLIKYMGVDYLSKDDLFHYMKIQYLYTRHDYYRLLISKNKKFIFEHLFREL